jgi:hypothetical protein
MTPCKATLAIRVNDDHRPIAVAVMAGSRLLAEVSIKDLLAIVAQLERLHGDAEQEDSEH